MSEVIPVLLTGAAGKMGLAAVKALSESPDTEPLQLGCGG
jgi:dihydrodipicolinate reductase